MNDLISNAPQAENEVPSSQPPSELTQLLNEVHNLISDKETLTEEALKFSQNLLLEKIQLFKEQLHTLQENIQERPLSENISSALENTQKYVQEHPIQSLGLAIGAGFILSNVLKSIRR